MTCIQTETFEIKYIIQHSAKMSSC